MMIHKVEENIFRIQLPMKVGLLDSLNAYLILGEKSLLIDTGHDREEVTGLLKKALSELGTSLEEVDIFLTHMHPDHSELAVRLASEGRSIKIGAYEADILNGKRPRPDAGPESLKIHGFPDTFIEEFSRIISKRRPPEGENRFVGVNEGDTLEYGGHKLLCIGIEGHSPGQTGLYIAEKKIFISGDHILYGVTPSVNAWNDEPNPLKVYLKNLNKIKNMEIETLLPGHRGVTCPVNERIDSIINRHYKKIEETSLLLKQNGPISPYGISSAITWNTRWDKLNTFQKFSAVCEVAIKLEYLVSTGEAKKTSDGQVNIFFAT